MTARSTAMLATVGEDGATTPIAWNAETFAAKCREIVASQCGHRAHRALDLLTNDVLRSLGFGEGIAVFEAAVARWHSAADPYPYAGPCPDCEAA